MAQITTQDGRVTDASSSRMNLVLEFVKENVSMTIGIIFLGLIIFMATFANVIAPYSFDQRFDGCSVDNPYCRYSPPSSDHLFGTNKAGRDMFSRVVYGSRFALQLTIITTVFSLLIGVPLGVFSGYYGGKLDRLLNAVADAIYSFPSLLLAITLAIVLANYGDLKTIVAVAGSTSVVYVPLYFKITRAQVLQVREETYVDAARSIGASNPTILGKYIVPNIFAAPVALIPFNMTEAILVNAGLAFLGLGIQPPTPDWGYDVFDNKSIVVVRETPFALFYPALFIFLLSFAFALVGDALNDKLNPLIRGDQS